MSAFAVDRGNGGRHPNELSNQELDALALDADERNSAPKVREFPTMDPAAFHGLPGEIVAALKPHTESDPVALLLTLHSFFGTPLVAARTIASKGIGIMQTYSRS
jgi:hypothetical protein